MVFGDQEYPEETRLRYRYLDLRREAMQENMMLRSDVVRLHARADVGAGFPRVPDADHHRLLARGRARLPRALAPASGQVLRAAAGAAAVQAADHGVGLRQVLPDRALLPRRGPARRPLAHGFLPARHGDELRRAAGRLRHDPAGDAGRLRGIRRRPEGRHRLAADLLHAMPRSGTAPTSRTCATRSRCRSSPSISAARASRSSPSCWSRRAPRSAPSPRRAAARASSATA